MNERSTPPFKMKEKPIYNKGNGCNGTTEKREMLKEFPQVSWFV